VYNAKLAAAVTQHPRGWPAKDGHDPFDNWDSLNQRTPALKELRSCGVEKLRSWTVLDFSASRLLDSSTSFRAKSTHEVGSTALWPPFRYPHPPSAF
jgi:hypothetical protein